MGQPEAAEPFPRSPMTTPEQQVPPQQPHTRYLGRVYPDDTIVSSRAVGVKAQKQEYSYSGYRSLHPWSGLFEICCKQPNLECVLKATTTSITLSQLLVPISLGVLNNMASPTWSGCNVSGLYKSGIEKYRDCRFRWSHVPEPYICTTYLLNTFDEPLRCITNHLCKRNNVSSSWQQS